MARLPDFVTRISPLGETLAAIDHGTALLTEDAAGRNAQLSVMTAEDGLSLWERDLSLPDGTGTETQTRRARVRAAMAGGQTLTKERLAELAVVVGDADSGEVEEDFAAWHVTLTALYENRTPGDPAALRNAVARLKPAHLEVTVAPVCCLPGATCRRTALTGGMLLCLTGRGA